MAFVDESQVVDVLKDLRSKGSDVIYAQAIWRPPPNEKKNHIKNQKNFGRLNLFSQ